MDHYDPNKLPFRSLKEHRPNLFRQIPRALFDAWCYIMYAWIAIFVVMFLAEHAPLWWESITTSLASFRDGIIAFGRGVMTFGEGCRCK